MKKNRPYEQPFGHATCFLDILNKRILLVKCFCGKPETLQKCFVVILVEFSYGIQSGDLVSKYH